MGINLSEVGIELGAVKEHSGKKMVCVDFSNLDQACPKDSFLLLQIDQMVDSITRYELLCFMDTYSVYNWILMYLADKEHTSFIMDRGLYYYEMVPFGLKNIEATYQRLVDKMLDDLIEKIMEVYMNDMLVKSLKIDGHI